jgi:hypothetical protein
MASSAPIVVSVVDARTETQKHIDNVFALLLRSESQRWRIAHSRQSRIASIKRSVSNEPMRDKLSTRIAMAKSSSNSFVLL